MAKKSNRMIIWEGVSRIDGSTPVIILATGFATGSQNTKTGGAIQTWIMRADTPPHHAIRLGLDACVCGDCPHRSKASGGTGACYVNTGQGPRSTFDAHQRSGSAPLDLAAFTDRPLRIGSYGDPAAAPDEVWLALAAAAGGRVLGYTHQWRHRPALAALCMASCDSIEEYREARRAGWRAFVVRPAGSAAPRGLVPCPASAEAGRRTQCAACMQCGGNSGGRRASITIEAHGSTRGAFAPRRSLPLAVA